MAQDQFAKMMEIDPLILTDVVQKDQNSPSLKITEWTVRRLSDKGIINPDGLWLFSGLGADRDGTRPWSVVLKTFQRPEQALPLHDMWNWERELLLAQSGLADQFTGHVKAPRFYRIENTPEGAWLWMERIIDRHPGPWALEEYVFAARKLGAWNGKYATGTSLPDAPWLSRQIYRSWVGDESPDQFWQFPYHKKHLSSDIRSRCEQLWIERENFFSVLETLPQIFSHFDCQRRNLFIHRGQNDEDELVLVDWALCGLGALGADLYSLVGMSCALLEWPPSEVVQLDAAVFEGYLLGLRDIGWSGEMEVVRLGFVAWQALWLGARMPFALSWWCSDEHQLFALQQFGLAEEDLFLNWIPLLSFSLDCADEARLLMKKLNLF